MPLEVYAIPAQSDAIATAHELLVSDRASVSGTGYRKLTDILDVGANQVDAFDPDVHRVMLGGGAGGADAAGGRLIASIMNGWAKHGSIYILQGAPQALALPAAGTVQLAGFTNGPTPKGMTYNAAAGTITIDEPGEFEIQAHVGLSYNITDTVYLQAFKAGVALLGDHVQQHVNAAEQYKTYGMVSERFSAVATDVLDLRMSSTVGGAATVLSAIFHVKRVG